MKISIIIPAYNEENTIYSIIDKVISVELINNIHKEIIIIDDASIDETRNIILRLIDERKEIDIQYYQQNKNKGKGAAIHQGIKYATGDYILIQDADLEYDPKEYNDLLKPIIDGHADVVYGSRFIGGKPHRILFFFHTLGNKILTNLSNLFTNLNLTDMETCYKVFDSRILKSIKLTEKRFGFEPEVTHKISKEKGVRIYEVGISYYGRTYDEGKKINWKDGVRAIYVILKYGLTYR